MRTCLFCFAFRSPLLNDQVLGPGRPPHIRRTSPNLPLIAPWCRNIQNPVMQIASQGLLQQMQMQHIFPKVFTNMEENHGWVSNWSLSLYIISHSYNEMVNCNMFHHQVMQQRDKFTKMRYIWQCVILKGRGHFWDGSRWRYWYWYWQCVILNTSILAAAAGLGTFLRRIQMKIGSESERDKSYGVGCRE